MSIFALTDEYVSFNSVVLSDHAKAGTINAEGDQLDATTFGSNWRAFIMGLKGGSVAIEFLDDFAAGSVDATTWAAFSAGLAVPIAIRPTSGAIATGNPEFQFSVLPNQWSLGGSIGDLAGKTLTFPITGAITRDTTP